FGRGGGRLALLTDGETLLFDRRSVCPRCDIAYPPLEPRLFSFSDPLGACPTCGGTGAVKEKRTRKKAGAPGADAPGEDDLPGPTPPSRPCPTCRGSRLNEQALAVRVGGRNLAELCALPVAELAAICAQPALLEAAGEAGRVLLRQVTSRLGYLEEVDLEYLTLDR